MTKKRNCTNVRSERTTKWPYIWRYMRERIESSWGNGNNSTYIKQVLKTNQVHQTKQYKLYLMTDKIHLVYHLSQIMNRLITLEYRFRNQYVLVSYEDLDTTQDSKLRPWVFEKRLSTISHLSHNYITLCIDSSHNSL